MVSVNERASVKVSNLRFFKPENTGSHSQLNGPSSARDSVVSKGGSEAHNRQSASASVSALSASAGLSAHYMETINLDIKEKIPLNRLREMQNMIDGLSKKEVNHLPQS
jgi:hypothetical protein